MAGDQQRAVETTTIAGIRPKVFAVVAPVILAGAVTVGVAIFRYVDAPRTASDVAALFGLMASMALANAKRSSAASTPARRCLAFRRSFIGSSRARIGLS